LDFADWLWSTGPVGWFGATPTILGFNLRHLSYYIAFPCWAPVAICVVLAIAPFLFRNSHLRFSLRTLLIATTLIAVVLGLIVWLR
jgi:multidrug transporter EmrE-like cation transporter